MSFQNDLSCELRPLDFEQLTSRCLGHLELAERLLASFERRFPDDLSQIEASLQAGDLDRLVRLAHQLKGATGNVSATALHAVMQRLEETGRNRQVDALPAHLDEARQAWDRFKEYKTSLSWSPSSKARTPAQCPQKEENSPCAY
jgi:HPt (histidine-containing phosphotransfer) domain-containing protein